MAQLDKLDSNGSNEPDISVPKTVEPNVIILTSGLSGSSVLTALICRAGYWSGDRTHKKPHYDTFENERLIELDCRIIAEAGYRGNYLLEFSPEAIAEIEASYAKAEHRPYCEFVEQCEWHRPWIWKDPRLWLTIRFWKNVIPLESCRFILLSRDSMQTWVSQTLRRQITSYRYSRKYECCIQDSVLRFLEENSLPYLHLRYEDLVMSPEPTIQSLNGFLGSRLKLEDLKEVYHKPLYKNPRSSLVKHLQAVAIYLKNYSQRLDLTPDNKRAM